MHCGALVLRNTRLVQSVPSAYKTAGLLLDLEFHKVIPGISNLEPLPFFPSHYYFREEDSILTCCIASFHDLLSIPRSAKPLGVGILIGTEQPRHSGHAFWDPWMFRSYMPVLAAVSSDAELEEVNPAWLPELCPKFFGASPGHSFHIVG